MNIFVVGGSGFLGRRVVQRLTQGGHRVSGLARSAAASDLLRTAGGLAVSGDLEAMDELDRAMREAKSEALLTSVSLGMGYGPGIVEAAEKAGVKRGVFLSTTSVYTRLPTPTRAIRLKAEERIRSSDIAWTILRPTMIYGAPEDRNMYLLLRFLRRSPVAPLPGGGAGLQQPVHVDDLADLVVSCFENDVAVGKTYDVAGPEALPFRSVVEEAAAAVGRRPVTLALPAGLAKGLIRIYQKVGGKRLRTEQVSRLAEDKAFDISQVREDLGFSPRSFREGITAEASLL